MIVQVPTPNIGSCSILKGLYIIAMNQMVGLKIECLIG